MSLGNFIKRFRDITRNDAGINGDAQRIEQLTWMLFLKIYDDMEIEKELLDETYESIIPEGFHWREWADTARDTALKGDELLETLLIISCSRRFRICRSLLVARDSKAL